MRSRAVIPILAVSLALIASLSSAGTSKKIKVRCDKGDSINEALMNDVEELIIEIRGMCREKVVVERKNVTLRGTDPAGDGITGPVLDLSDPNDRALVTVLGIVGGVRFENLLFTGSLGRGLEIRDEAFVEVADCRFSGNNRALSVINNGRAMVTDSRFSNNDFYQLLSWAHGLISCTRCTIGAAPVFGVVSHSHGRMALEDSSVEAGDWAVSVGENSFFWATDTDITAGSWAVYASEGAQISIKGTDVGNPPVLSGSVYTELNSKIWLEGVNQTVNPLWNYVGEDSNLNLLDSALVGETYLNRFANGTAEGKSSLGDLACDRGADFFCDPGVTPDSSSCDQCPVP